MTGGRWDLGVSGLLAFLHSIRFRITLWFVLILAIVLAGFSLLIYVTQSRDLQVDALEHMQESYRGIEESIGNDEWQPSDPSVGGVTGGGPLLRGGDLLLVVGSDGYVLAQWGVATSDPQALAGALVQAGDEQDDHGVLERSVSVAGADGRMAPTDYLFVLSPVRHDNELSGYLVLGSPSDLRRQQHRLAVTLALGSLATLAVAFLGGFWLADRAMRPVSAIAVAARAIGETDLSRRLNLRGRDELAALARTFDEMIGRRAAAALHR